MSPHCTKFMANKFCAVWWGPNYGLRSNEEKKEEMQEI